MKSAGVNNYQSPFPHTDRVSRRLMPIFPYFLPVSCLKRYQLLTAQDTR
jgi:hypothetical protein